MKHSQELDSCRSCAGNCNPRSCMHMQESGTPEHQGLCQRCEASWPELGTYAMGDPWEVAAHPTHPHCNLCVSNILLHPYVHNIQKPNLHHSAVQSLYYPCMPYRGHRPCSRHAQSFPPHESLQLSHNVRYAATPPPLLEHKEHMSTARHTGKRAQATGTAVANSEFTPQQHCRPSSMDLNGFDSTDSTQTQPLQLGTKGLTDLLASLRLLANATFPVPQAPTESSQDQVGHAHQLPADIRSFVDS